MIIDTKLLNKLSQEFNKSPKNILARNATTNIDLTKLLLNRDKIQKFNAVFSNQLDLGEDVAPKDQQNSGRCWIYTFCNIIR